MKNVKTLDELGIQQVGEPGMGIREFRLRNGLKVLLLEDHTAPILTFLVVYKVGSRNEGAGNTGSTHFLEHMMFKGTAKHNKEKGTNLDQLLAPIGGWNNATTWFDRTMYFEMVPSEYLELLVRLESDRMRGLRLRQEDHDSEMRVVRNELEQGENWPEDAMQKLLYGTAFQEHPYHHDTIGFRSDVEGVPMSRLREFYDQHYWPNNATVVITGDIDTEEALRLVHKYYGPIPSSPAPIPPMYTTEPKQQGQRRFEVRKGGDLPRVAIAFHTPEATHPDVFPLTVLGHVLGSSWGRFSRLYRRLDDQKLATQVFCRVDELKDPGLFTVSTTLHKGTSPELVEQIILEEIAKIASGESPATDQELALIREANRKNTILAMAAPRRLGFVIGEAESHDTWRRLLDYDEKLDAVTADDVARVAREYLTRDNRTIGYFIPKDESELTINQPAETEEAEPEVTEKKTLTNEKKARKPRRPESLRRILKPTMKARATIADKVQRVVLPNGLTLLVVPNRGSRAAAVNVLVKAGNFFEPKSQQNLSDVVGDMLSKGSQNYDKTQIAEELAEMGMQYGMFLHCDAFCAHIGSMLVASDLSRYLNLLADILRRPVFAEDELDKTKVEWTTRYIQDKNHPRGLAGNAFGRAAYDTDHVFHQKSFEDMTADLESITVADLQAFHSQHYVPSGTIIAVVGDFDADEAVAAVKAAFGDWDGPQARTIEVPAQSLRHSLSTIKLPMAEKSTVDMVLGHVTTVRKGDDDYLAVVLANAILGSDTILSRLGKTLREDEGLTYGAYSYFWNNTFGNAPWQVSLSVNPANADKALRLARQVLTRWHEKGVTQHELDREAGRQAGTFQMRIADFFGIASMLTNIELGGGKLEEIDNYAADVRKVTKDQVNAAIRKHFHPDRLITVQAGTFK